MFNTRRVSERHAVDSGYPHYRVVMAASPESATVLGCFLGDGAQPPLHIPLGSWSRSPAAEAAQLPEGPGGGYQGLGWRPRQAFGAPAALQVS